MSISKLSDETLNEREANDIMACSNLTLINWFWFYWSYEGGLSMFNAISDTNSISRTGIQN
jgi:hypothetical protein